MMGAQKLENLKKEEDKSRADAVKLGEVRWQWHGEIESDGFT